MADFRSTTHCPAGDFSGAVDSIALDYAGRLLRRRMIVTQSGREVLVDFPRAVSLNHGDGLIVADLGPVEVIAAAEEVMRVTGADLLRYAWHIGNRHAPCEIHPEALTLKPDPVLRDMLQHLGAAVEVVTHPFTPEGGAYGHGRTFGHSHDHDHSNSHDHDHHH